MLEILEQASQPVESQIDLTDLATNMGAYVVSTTTQNALAFHIICNQAAEWSIDIPAAQRSLLIGALPLWLRCHISDDVASYESQIFSTARMLNWEMRIDPITLYLQSVESLQWLLHHQRTTEEFTHSVRLGKLVSNLCRRIDAVAGNQFVELEEPEEAAEYGGWTAW
ncbi:MAG: hypothetical protein AAF413_04770 [Patescibacteria group bacterium]